MGAAMAIIATAYDPLREPWAAWQLGDPCRARDDHFDAHPLWTFLFTTEGFRPGEDRCGSLQEWRR